MGVTRQYLRYAQCEVFGVIASNVSNIVFLDIRGVRGKYCAVGACEDVIIWDIRTGDKYQTLKGDKHVVTKIARSADKHSIAVGYNDGTVCVYDIVSGEKTITFSGHKSAVTALKYDKRGLRLVSGGKDTDVIVWDIVNECGLYRLKGHKGMVTQAAFLHHRNVLVSCSKDTFVKFWDLDTQHCFTTLVGHRSEVYDMVMLRDDHRLVTGSADSELRVWDITYDPAKVMKDEPSTKKSKTDFGDDDDEDDDLNILSCQKVGSVMRSGRERLVSMATDEQQKVLICHGSDRSVEIFNLPTDDQLQKKLNKRLKKVRKRQRETESTVDTEEAKLNLQDEICKATSVKMAAKLSSVDIITEHNGLSKVISVYNTNRIGYFSIRPQEKKAAAEGLGQLSQLGHSSDVRTLSFSSDSTALLSGSAETIKVWNRASLQCIRTMACDYTLCSLFAPGDQHIVTGSKGGKLQIFNIGQGSLSENIDAHEGAVWSICMSPDKRGLVSGSADKMVKFWNFELMSDTEHNTARVSALTLQHVKTLKMDDDVLCVRYSPDQRLIAVSLLDSTVKVFFADTLKFFLSLYGHKLPVLCMDISSDSQLLVSGSADRNVKIWGLDFGDCHKSIFAHDDSIMSLQFIPKTHMFFTGGKDKKVKQWDADNFEHIITLEGHQGEVWSLCTSQSGNVLATASHDKSLRIWEKTQEPLVLEEEREMTREKEFEDSVTQSGESVVPGETNTETGLAGKKSIETVKAAERLMEALEIYRGELEKRESHKRECAVAKKDLPEPEPHPMMVAFGVSSPERYVLLVLKKIKSSELEESLLVLPFSYISDLLSLLDHFVSHVWEVELSSRCLFFLLRVHHGQITSNQMLLPVIDRLRMTTVDKVNTLRDTVGYNLAGLEHLQRDMEGADNAVFFLDATQRAEDKKRKQKKKAILAIKT